MTVNTRLMNTYPEGPLKLFGRASSETTGITLSMGKQMCLIFHLMHSAIEHFPTLRITPLQNKK